jgi:hypothetical protein
MQQFIIGEQPGVISNGRTDVQGPPKYFNLVRCDKNAIAPFTQNKA